MKATLPSRRSGASPGTRSQARPASRKPAAAGRKKRFDIDDVLARIRHRVGDLADAAMFDLRDNYGFGTLFQQLVACIISIRTRDEVSLPVARELLEAAPSPEAIARMPVKRIDALIRRSSFHEAKAAQIQTIARRTVEEYGGKLPCDPDTLMSFKGVGPKCANLALGVACGEASIAVDIHVHRVTNRWGIVSTPTPMATMTALGPVVPRKYWVEINRLLVPFGKHVCTGVRPKCSECPVVEYCRQVGVTEHR